MCSRMRGLPFHKMHGCGNDFVVVDARHRPVGLDRSTVRRIADRHRGVGFDQLVLIEPGSEADARLVFFNSDGGEAGACGNGTRCAARLLGDETGHHSLVLDTAGGRLRAHRAGEDRWAVAMPAPHLGWRDVPLAEECDTLRVPVDVDGLRHPVALSMGNPHAVFIVEDLAAVDVARLGPLLEAHRMFPERANVGFAEIVDRARLRLRVHERGAGLTKACGSGACAAVVAAHRLGLVDGQVTVVVDGGELEIAWDGAGPVTMTGPTAHVFSGTLGTELLGTLVDE